MAWEVSRRQKYRAPNTNRVTPNSSSIQDEEGFIIKLPEKEPINMQPIVSKFIPISNEKEATFTSETAGLVTLTQFRMKKQELEKLEDPATQNAKETDLAQVGRKRFVNVDLFFFLNKLLPFPRHFPSHEYCCFFD